MVTDHVGVLVDGMVPEGDAGAIGTVTDAVSLTAVWVGGAKGELVRGRVLGRGATAAWVGV